MTDRGGDLHGDSHGHERGADPERDAGVGLRSEMLVHLQLAEKEAETSDDESKTHQCQAGTQPRKIGALGGEEISDIVWL